MSEAVINKTKALGAKISLAFATVCIAFRHGVGADEDVFQNAETGLSDIYSKFLSLAPKLIGVLGILALLAWIFWPSAKGAEKGKTWFIRIMCGVIGIVLLGVIIATLVNKFNGGKSPMDIDFNSTSN